MLAEETEPKLLGAEQATWLRRLDEEHENLRSALDWCLSQGQWRPGLRLCGSLQRFWWARGHLTEGRETCVRLLGMAGAEERTHERSKALSVAGVLAYHQCDYPAARALGGESLAIRRELGDRKGIAASLNNLGLVACDEGDFASARALYEESLAIKRALEDRAGIANSLNNLGNVAYDQADFTAARALYDQSLVIARELGDREAVSRLLSSLGNVAMHQRDLASARALHEESLAIKRELGYRQRIASSLNSLGNLAADQGDFEASRDLYEEGLAIEIELGDKLRIAVSLRGLAAVAVALGNPLHAARIWGAAERLRAEVGSPLSPNDRVDCDRRVAAARAAAGDDAAFDCAWREGHSLTLKQAATLALGESPART